MSFCVFSARGVADFAAVAVCGFVVELDAAVPLFAVLAGLAVDVEVCWAARFPSKRTDAARALSRKDQIFCMVMIVASAEMHCKAS